MANSFPGSGLTYVDQLSVGASSASQIFEVKSSSNDGACKKYLFKGWDSTGNGNGIALRVFDTQSGVGFADVGADYFGANGANTTLTFSTRNACAALAEGMRITNTGNVGINCSDPNNKLTIAGTSAILGVITATTAGSSYAVFRNTADTIAGYIGLDGNGLVGAENGSMMMASNAGKSIIFAPALTEKMRITSTGKVSVGSTSANGQLSVTVDQSVNNQHFNIVGTQASYNQEYSFGIPTSTKDLRIYDGTAGAVRFTLTCLGNIGINTTSPGSYKLNVNGAFYAAGSSCEYKTQICQYNTDSCMFMKLTPVTYQYKDEWSYLGKELKSGTQIGLIAEDVAEVFPELAMMKEDIDGEKRVRNVDYEKLSIILLSELQKLRAEVDELKTK
jgi:hypothetical protein